MIRTVPRLAAALAFVAAIILAASAPVRAEAQYSDAKLKSFVVAALEVNRLVDQWEPKIRSAPDQQQAAQMTEQANADLVAAVERTEGITLDEYNEIATAVQTDEALSKRVYDIASTLEKPAK